MVRLQRLIHHPAVLGRHHLVVERMSEEDRRRFRGDLFLVREKFDQIRGWRIAKQISPRAAMRFLAHRNDGVNEYCEIRTRANALERICGVRLAAVEMGSGGGSEVAAGGEADDAD